MANSVVVHLSLEEVSSPHLRSHTSQPLANSRTYDYKYHLTKNCKKIIHIAIQYENSVKLYMPTCRRPFSLRYSKIKN